MRFSLRFSIVDLLLGFRFQCFSPHSLLVNLALLQSFKTIKVSSGSQAGPAAAYIQRTRQSLLRYSHTLHQGSNVESELARAERVGWGVGCESPLEEDLQMNCSER